MKANKKIRIRSLIIAAVLMLVSIFAYGYIKKSNNDVANYMKTFELSAEEQQTLDSIYISEENYDENMDQIVLPFLEQYKQTGYLDGLENTSLYYETYIKEDRKGTIVLVHGLGESLEKYDEMIYYFVNMGYSVFAMEHRGHSRSGRLGMDETQVNIESFDYYVEDLKNFIDTIVLPEAEGDRMYLFGHSMGGCISARFLETYTDYFDAAVLCAPMLDIDSGNVPSFLAKMIAHVASKTKYADKYILGKGPYTDIYSYEEAYTTSEARYKRAWQTRIDEEVTQMGDGSFRWLSESYNAIKKAISKSEVSKIQVPVLLFQGGQDSLVCPEGQNTFVKNVPNCSMIRYEDAKHEVYGETDVILADFLKNIFGFYNSSSQN